MTQSFVPGKHCCFSFTHESAEGMTMELAQLYADNILRVLRDGGAPSVTAAHNERILRDALPPGMPKEYLQRIEGFDVHKADEAWKAVPAGAIRVESIATCMGCVVATCVADVEALPHIVKGMVGWAEPIMTANKQKGDTCAEFRRHLEPEHCVAPAQGGELKLVLIPQQQQGAQEEEDDRMRVGALFVPQEAGDEHEAAATGEQLTHHSSNVPGRTMSPAEWVQRLYL